MTQKDIDPYDTLVKARPTSTEIDRVLSADQRSSILCEAKRDPGPTRRKIWHRWLAVAAAGLVAGAALVVRDVLAGDSAPRADALVALSQKAAQSPDLTIPEGNFLAQTTVSKVAGIPASEVDYQYGADWFPSISRSWTSADGHVWRCDIRPSGTTEYLELSAPPTEWSPAAVAALPSDPVALRDHFSARVTGSNSDEEAIFQGVQGILTPGYAPPKVQEAAIQALAQLNAVTVQLGKAPSGRTLLEVRYYEPKARGKESLSLWFDQALGRLVETSSYLYQNGQIAFTTYEVIGLVDAVPADVLALANPMSDDQPPIHAPTSQPSPSCT